jgi:hypothetical protein
MTPHFIRDGGSPVLRIDIPWMFEVVKALDDLNHVKFGTKISDVYGYLFVSKYRLEEVFNRSVYAPYLNISLKNAQMLYARINEILENSDSDSTQTISEFEDYSIHDLQNKFEAVFLAEISAMPAYLVSPKGSYNIHYLIEAGESLFPSNLLTKAPDAEEDAKKVGRCLAYERYTACGFHTFRVVETVLRRYWDHESSGKTRPVPQTLGNMAAQLKVQQLGDDKVTESLIQLSKLHRNPLAHPDVILTGDEAVATVGMARSVITAMLANLPDVPPTTGAVATV